MNDFSQNELFSAYLDGEATAKERAEVERLLAADPAARQAFEELRAVSHSVQSLPQATLGIDLSDAVLQEVQQRAGLPSEQTIATPLAKAIFRRFATRRNMARLALTAAAVVMILIYDRQNALQNAPEPATQVAVARAKPEPQRTPDEAWSPPTMQAASEPTTESSADVAKGESAQPNAPAPASSLAGEENFAESLDRDAELGEDVTVVRCDVSPQAVETQTFDRLLLSNGIPAQNQLLTMQENQQPVDAAYAARSPQTVKPAEGQSDETFVFVEAMPEQINAALADMSAQPEAFSNVAVSPPQDANAQQLVRQFNRAQNIQQPLPEKSKLLQPQSLARSAENAKPFTTSGPAADEPTADAPQPPPLGTPLEEERQLGEKADQESKDFAAAKKRDAFSAEKQSSAIRRQAGELSKPQNPLRSGQSNQALRQRVLFVLRVVDPSNAQPTTPTDSAAPADSR